MTDYSQLKGLFIDYDAADNVERGWSWAKVEAIHQKIKAECARLGASTTEGRRLALEVPGLQRVEVTGPAHVLTDGNEVRRFDSAESADAARSGWQPMGYFVPAGETRAFPVAA